MGGADLYREIRFIPSRPKADRETKYLAKHDNICRFQVKVTIIGDTVDTPSRLSNMFITSIIISTRSV